MSTLCENDHVFFLMTFFFQLFFYWQIQINTKASTYCFYITNHKEMMFFL